MKNEAYVALEDGAAEFWFDDNRGEEHYRSLIPGSAKNARFVVLNFPEPSLIICSDGSVWNIDDDVKFA